MMDPFHLQRFIDAQNPVIDAVLTELRAGCKTSHWMWYVFPQLAGLGYSDMAQRYAIRTLDEAKAYIAHPTLGPRLRECTRLVNAVEGRPISQILGYPDYLKFRSSMTLFREATPENVEFAEAIRKYFQGEADEWTVAALRVRNS